MQSKIAIGRVLIVNMSGEDASRGFPAVGGLICRRIPKPLEGCLSRARQSRAIEVVEMIAASGYSATPIISRVEDGEPALAPAPLLRQIA